MNRMRRLYSDDDNQTGLVLSIAFFLAFIILAFNRGDAHISRQSQSALDDKTSPIVQILSYPIRGAENFIKANSDRNKAYEENIALRQELIALRDRQLQFDLLQLKVKRYEKILSVNFDAKVNTDKIVARAIAENNGPFVRSLLLNSGQRQGVEIGNPVLNSEGLIGHVIAAGQNSARVLHISDLNSRIPVINLRSDGKAIMSGNNSPDPDLTFIQKQDQWKAGDKIMTSGDGGMLPAGLPIGSIFQTDESGFKVKLHANSQAIDWVWIASFAPIDVPDGDETDEDVLKENALEQGALNKGFLKPDPDTINPTLDEGDNITPIPADQRSLSANTPPALPRPQGQDQSAPAPLNQGAEP